MSDYLFIDVWSDVVCPFCYLGTRQLSGALERFEHRADVVVRHRAFELDSSAPRDYKLSLPELLAKKYSMPVERAKVLNDRLEGDAAALGMTWSMKDARPTNTFDAHRVITLAATQSKSAAMSERLFRAYFCEGLLVSDHSVLTALANEVGVGDVQSLWASGLYAGEVRADEVAATELGISGVPSLLIDEKFMVVGAQGSDHILDVLTRAWTRRVTA
ncbi:MAG: DsbA family oxidoreductase [Acidimicrobiales bacterium]|jgi:predicted DsbA family dithiol-disulfide isomerase